MQLPFEFGEENLTFLRYMFEGLCYLAMLKMFQANPEFTKNLASMASLNREVHVWFLNAKTLADNFKQIRSYHQAMIPDVYYNFYKYGYDALSCITLKLLAEHEEEMTKGYNGIAISYMYQIQNILKMIRDDKFLKKEDKKTFENMYKDHKWDEKLKDTKEKNQKIYKAQIPESSEVKSIEDWDKKLTDLAPVNVYIPPEGYQHYQNFLSEELEKINSNLNLYLQTKKQF